MEFWRTLFGICCITPTGAMDVHGNSPVYALYGHSAELSCLFKVSSTVQTSISWIFADGHSRDGRTIINIDGQCSIEESANYRTVVYRDSGEVKLIVLEVGPSDNGTYSCLISSSQDAGSAQVDLIVKNYSDRRPNVSCPREVTLESVFNAWCDQEEENGGWIHYHRHFTVVKENSSLILFTEIEESTQFELVTQLSRQTIPTANEEGGITLTYKCCTRALGTCFPFDSRCSDLCNTTLLYPPTETHVVLTESGPWIEGSTHDVSIICTSNGVPMPELTWRKSDEHQVSDNQIFGPGSTLLQFSQVFRNQSGTYLCHHISNNPPPPTEVKIIVHYPPRINRSLSVVHANEGTVVSLRCIVDSNPLVTSLEWTTPNSSMIDSYQVKREISRTEFRAMSENRLEFNGAVRKQMFGNYTCIAENAVGKDAHVIVLTGNSHPQPPENLRITKRSATSLEITWEPGSNGGLSVTYTITHCAQRNHVEHCIKVMDIEGNNHTVYDLHSTTWYRITVSAENELGPSTNNPELIASTAPAKTGFLGLHIVILIVILPCIGLMALAFLTLIVTHRTWQTKGLYGSNKLHFPPRSLNPSPMNSDESLAAKSDGGNQNYDAIEDLQIRVQMSPYKPLVKLLRGCSSHVAPHSPVTRDVGSSPEHYQNNRSVSTAQKQTYNGTYTTAIKHVVKEDPQDESFLHQSQNIGDDLDVFNGDDPQQDESQQSSCSNNSPEDTVFQDGKGLAPTIEKQRLDSEYLEPMKMVYPCEETAL